MLKSLKQIKQLNEQFGISLLHVSARCNWQEVTIVWVSETQVSTTGKWIEQVSIAYQTMHERLRDKHG